MIRMRRGRALCILIVAFGLVLAIYAFSVNRVANDTAERTAVRDQIKKQYKYRVTVITPTDHPHPTTTAYAANVFRFEPKYNGVNTTYLVLESVADADPQSVVVEGKTIHTIIHFPNIAIPIQFPTTVTIELR